MSHREKCFMYCGISVAVFAGPPETVAWLAAFDLLFGLAFTIAGCYHCVKYVVSR